MLVVLLAIFSVFVSTAASADDDLEILNVVATVPVLGVLASAIGGGRVAVQVLSDAHQDPHFVQPRPTLMKKVRTADVFIEVGLGLELWAQKVVDGSGNTKVQTGQPGRIVASAGVPTLDQPTVLSRAGGDVHPQGNPHIWLDPLNAKRMAAAIAAGLSRVAPDSAGAFAENLKRFCDRVDRALFGDALVDDVGGAKLTRLAESGSLDAYLSEHDLDDKLGGWLGRARSFGAPTFVTYHKTWVYFAHRFGFTIPIEIEEKPGIAPSAKHRDAVIDIVKSQSVAAILMTTFYDRRAADYIAERTDIPVAVIAIEPSAESGGASYVAFIDYLLDRVDEVVTAAGAR